MTLASVPPAVSVVVPVRNEAGNIKPLVAEIAAACSAFPSFEVIYVDDGSTDKTSEILSDLKKSSPWLRVLRHNTSCGQSAAVRSGVMAALAPIVVTIDGDGQNNPEYIPALVAALSGGDLLIGLAAGQRLGRKDTGFKKMQSRIANSVRRFILKDGTRDTGCGLKAFRRNVYLSLPYFDALHRFMPALVRREGFLVVTVDVVDRQRLTGTSNYGFFDRLWVGMLDLAGVWWLIQRKRNQPQVEEVI